MRGENGLWASLLVTAACLVSSPSPAAEEGPQPGSDEAHPIAFNAHQLDLAAVALDAFKKQNPNWQCFNVMMFAEADRWQVAFVPKDDVQVTGETIVVGASKCGPGMTFIVSETGKIVGTIHHR